MPSWEYKVVPTPRRPKRAKGVKGNPDRFAYALTEVINEVAAEGWEFVKTETLPMEAKPGIFKARVEVFQSLMVFRRPLEAPAVAPQMDPGDIVPAVAPAAAALTAERYAEPSDYNQTQISAEPPLFEDPEPPIFDDETVVGTPSEAAGAPVEDYDVHTIDPLKRVVEANRTGG